MRSHLLYSAAALAVILNLPANSALADQKVDEAIRAKALPQIQKLAASQDVVAAIRAQNQTTGDYDSSKIDALDKQWRAETAADQKPLIEAVQQNPLNADLRSFQQDGHGVFGEVIVMDGKGLNVALSEVTSDYWQGDEDKWQKTAGIGPDGVFIDEVEFDDSTQSFQSQVSVTVVDPDTGSAIGAITVGVVVDAL